MKEPVGFVGFFGNVTIALVIAIIFFSIASFISSSVWGSYHPVAEGVMLEDKEIAKGLFRVYDQELGVACYTSVRAISCVSLM